MMQDGAGNQELELALRSMDVGRVQRALVAGANPNAPVIDGVHTPLYYAARWHRWDILEALIEAGALVSVESEFETTSLHETVRGIGGWQAVGTPVDLRPIRLLLAPQPLAVLNKFDHTGYSPLMLSRSAEITRLLLEAGAEPGAQHLPEGDTALHLAAAGSDVEQVKLLLEAGANPKQTGGWDGDTAIDVARKNRNPRGPDILRMLEQAAGDRKRKRRR